MYKKITFIVLCALVFVACGPKDPIVKPLNATDSVERTEAVENIARFVDLSGFEDYEVEASSVLKDTTGIGFGYSPEMAFDRDFSTAWCVKPSDEERTLVLKFDDLVKAGKMGIVPGFARDEEIYFQNSRVTQLKVSADSGDGEFKDVGVYSLADKYGMQFIDLEDVLAKNLKFEILEVVDESKYDDICFAELDFWSDYVDEQDSGAALKYYEENKADNALRPNDIVENVIVTDFVYALGTEASKNSYGPYECDGSFTPPTVSKLEDYYHNQEAFSVPGFNVYAFAKVNGFGMDGDLLDVNWYYKTPVLPGNDEEAIFEAMKNAKWNLLDSEKNVEVVKTCDDGPLYAYAFLDKGKVIEGFGGGMGGSFKVDFLHNGRVVGSAKFYSGQ